MRVSRTFLVSLVLALPLGAQTLKPLAVQALNDVTVAVDAPDTVLDLRPIFLIDGVTGTIARFDTIRGLINVELFDAQAPVGVPNFLAYVDLGRYDDTLIHRSMPGFVIQGGGFRVPNPATDYPPRVDAFNPIVNESGIANTRGTLAWARTSELNSATSEWFFNLVDNAFLDDIASPYAVFGRVIGNSILVVDALAAIPNYDADGVSFNVLNNFPLINPVMARENFVIINKVRTIPIYPTQGRIDSALTFTVSSSNTDLVTPTVEYASLRLAFQAGQAGTATITVQCADSDGSLAEVRFQVEVATNAPTITAEPLGRSVLVGGALTLGVGVESASTPVYQWRKNNVAISAATSETLVLSDVNTSDTGIYDVIVTDSAGSVTSASTLVTVVNDLGRLTNLSTRAVTSEDGPYIWTTPGFVVQGSGSIDILARAVGPGLDAFGVTGFLVNPTMALSPLGDATNLIASNDDWESFADQGALSAASESVGAFALVAGDKDAAILASVSSDAYTSTIFSQDGSKGVVLGEVYVVGEPVAGGASLVNLSNRGFVGADAEVMIGGLVVAGDGPVNLLIRGVGPTLTSFGVNGVLADPVLTVRNAAETVIGTNDNWGDANLGASLSGITTSVGAFALDAESNDAAMLLVLEPGVYTVTLSGQDSGTGTGLLEFYVVN